MLVTQQKTFFFVNGIQLNMQTNINLTFNEELSRLEDLIEFKRYERVGDVLYARYDTLRPECTLSELVWGNCKSPCFANRLIEQLREIVPSFPSILSQTNREVSNYLTFRTFDEAIGMINDTEDDGIHVVYSTENSNPADCVYEEGDSQKRMMVATDEDGELWCGVVISEALLQGIDDITVTFFDSKQQSIWEQTFSHGAVVRRTKDRNGKLIFQPFRHPVPLLDLEISIVTVIRFNQSACNYFATQLFGIVSNDFCEWLGRSLFEIKLCRGWSVVMDMPTGRIKFRKKK